MNAITGSLLDVSTVSAALRWGVGFLRHAMFDHAETEAAVILSEVLDKPFSWLHLHPDKVVPSDSVRAYSAALRRRLRHEPVAYIFGRKNFLGHDFEVNRSVFIPRPETEELVETAIRKLKSKKGRLKVLEIGTGSGCIAVSLALGADTAGIVATDVSWGALEIASRNARAHGVSDRIEFLRSNLFSAFERVSPGPFDLIISNPPYVSSTDLKDLAPDLSFEPPLALEAGADGLEVIRPLIKGSVSWSAPAGAIMLEIGARQGVAVKQHLIEAGYQDPEIRKDIQGHDRMAVGELKG